ncbi:lipoyl protein ligase domain-containing protein [Haloferula sargassicola]|uniref:Octanoyltransferase LipM n=1 Tax=Haloferula sargassicola TaxID=490096 RepID=A0ABP9UQJ3_9BACT
MSLLKLWFDEMPREGPENMAVDEWLLETVEAPLLRIYGWRGEWGTCGYFVPAGEVEALLGGIPWVRRWTGGGIVDHRADWTYTLVIPRGERLAEAKGSSSYRIIHAALAAALSGRGVSLAGERPPARGGACFTTAVEHDLVDATGRKLAGAGQRRTRKGLLHQGSLAVSLRPEEAWSFARKLAEGVRETEVEPDPGRVAELVNLRYGDGAWNHRR